MKYRWIPTTIAAVLTLAACGGSGSTSETSTTADVPLQKNSALPMWGQRWVGATFQSIHYDTSKLPLCTDAPAPTGLTYGSATKLEDVHITWKGSPTGPATEASADIVLLERRAGNGSVWTTLAHVRVSANGVRPIGASKGSMLRVALYRTQVNPCITARSNEVRWDPNLSVMGGSGRP